MSDARKLRFKTGLTLLVTISVFHELTALPGRPRSRSAIPLPADLIDLSRDA